MHFAQVTPPRPQLVFCVPAEQVVPEQQPVHVAGSHTHEPPSQRWPTAHAAPVPQPQVPVLRQVLASVGLQLAQSAPTAPQAVAVRGVTQPPSASQQPAHVDALQPPTHAPETHAPPLQSLQRAPPVPQPVAELPCWQTPLKQHPEGQFCASQAVLMHAPFRHAPWPQSMHVAPPVPHAAAAVPVTHWPSAQQPVGHVSGEQALVPQ